MLKIEGLSVADHVGQLAVEELSLEIRAGEIVGVAGVSGNGQRELVETLAGQRHAEAGRMLVHGELYTATRPEMIRHKIACLPEEPLRNACVADMSVAENMALPVLRPAALVARRRAAKTRADARHRAQADRGLSREDARPRRADPQACRAATCSAPCWRASCRARSIC